MSTPDFSSLPASANNLEDRVRSDAASLADTARRDLEDVGNELKHEAASIAEEARGQLEQATEKAKGMAEEQKHALVAQLDEVSNSLDKVAGELEQKGESSAHYVRMVADGASKLTSTVRDNSVDNILAMAEDFGRKQPVAFMGAAALLGFVASRFMVASASRRAEESSRATSTDDHTSMTTSGSYGADMLGPASNAPSYDQSVGGNDAGI
jgi:ElaB/YqjD/DUF883 family membrane-anchored ribosome-binding protein